MIALLRKLLGRDEVFGGRPRSPRWPGVRAVHLGRQPRCAACGSAKSVQVHHIRPYHLFPALELDPTNLLTLCTGRQSCNCHLTFGHLGDWEHFNYDVVEDAARYLARLREVRNHAR